MNIDGLNGLNLAADKVRKEVDEQATRQTSAVWEECSSSFEAAKPNAMVDDVSLVGVVREYRVNS